MMQEMSLDAAVAKVVQFFEQLTPQSLATQLQEIYSEEVYFKDPFNEVRGLTATHRVFAHMFEQLHNPRFVITGRVQQTSTQAGVWAEVFLIWDFDYQVRGQDLRIHGCSHLHLAADGRISRHRDYWDVAEELYEKIPFLGGLMRVLKRKISSTNRAF
jgi:steroid delta-isomerase